MASDSDDDMHLQQRKAAPIAASSFPGSESEDDVPLANRAVALEPNTNGNAVSRNGVSHGMTTAANPNEREWLAAMNYQESSSSEDDIPLGSQVCNLC